MKMTAHYWRSMYKDQLRRKRALHERYNALHREAVQLHADNVVLCRLNQTLREERDEAAGLSHRYRSEAERLSRESAEQGAMRTDE